MEVETSQITIIGNKLNESNYIKWSQISQDVYLWRSEKRIPQIPQSAKDPKSKNMEG